jgi:hypothetical protein
MADMRRCIGSARYGIEAHDAPVEDFPKQASQKDGLGRMCRVHWNEYTKGLARDAKARKAAAAPATPTVEAAGPEEGTPATSEPRAPKKVKVATEATAG